MPTTQIYNTTPYKLRVVFRNGDTDEHLTAVTRYPMDSRCIAFGTTDLACLGVTVEAWTYNGVRIKDASFYTRPEDSWVVSDAEIRRREVGAALYVAAQYRYDQIAAHSTDDARKKAFHKHLAQHDWVTRTPPAAAVLYADREIMASQTELSMLSRVYRAAAARIVESQLGDGDECKPFHDASRTVCVFNDSPYYLEIYMDCTAGTRLFWNDPKGIGGAGRTVAFDTIGKTSDSSVTVTIHAVDDIGRRIKFVVFRTPNNMSWIVSDECVVRRRPNAAEYVADQYSDRDVEAGKEFWHRKVHHWQFRDFDSTLPPGLVAAVIDTSASSSSVSEDDGVVVSAVEQQFTGVARSRRFSPMSIDDRYVAMILTTSVTFGTPNSESKMSISTQRDAADTPLQASMIEQFPPGKKEEGGGHGGGAVVVVRKSPVAAVPSFERLQHRLADYRVVFRSAPGNAHYRLCEIRGQKLPLLVGGGRCLFAAVFMHRGMTYLSASHLRMALHMSLDYATGVVVSESNEPERPAAGCPPDVGLSAEQPFILLVSVAIQKTSSYIRFWTTANKREPEGLSVRR